MRFADVCVMLSFLVVVAIIARMLKAIRLLDGRVTLLQEQFSQRRAVMKKAAGANLRPPASVAGPKRRLGPRLLVVGLGQQL